MKKLLIIITVINIVCCGSANATEKTYSTDIYNEDSPYWRLDISGSKFNKSSMNGNVYKHQDYTYGIDAGLGYYWAEKIRAEIVYNHNFVSRFKSYGKDKDKVYTNALFLRTMFDLLRCEESRIFIGAGVGVSYTSHKITQASREKNSSGHKYHVAYSIHAGGASNITEDVRLELAWSLRDYGKIRGFNNIEGSNRKLLSHVISLGLRFDI